ncbi:hypothetical protein EDB83DRAFT_2638464 [Lactarius deliciosus]|nr:hypothetical protein EDB83DRAFT_2638464 [Lactarius deliciosus]
MAASGLTMGSRSSLILTTRLIQYHQPVLVDRPLSKHHRHRSCGLEVPFSESYVAVTSYGSIPTLVSSQEKAPSTATCPDITHGRGRCKSFSSPDITFAVFTGRLGRIGRCNAEGARVRMTLELSSTFTLSDPSARGNVLGQASSFKHQALLAKNVMPSRIDRKPTGVDRSCCIPRQKLFGLLEDMQKSQEQFFVGNFSWCPVTVTSITVLHTSPRWLPPS